MSRFNTATMGLAFLAASAMLAGCNGGSGGGTAPREDVPFSGSELPPGAYYLLRDYDDYNRYEQYFIVRPGGEWEFVEFGFRRKDSALVQLTRQIGIYDLRGDTLIMGATHTGEMEGAPIIGEMMAAFPFKPIIGYAGRLFVRNVFADRFSARDLFEGKSGWQNYILGKLPASLPAPALGPLPRTFAAQLFVAQDTVRVVEGEAFDLDLAGPAPNPRTAKYFLYGNFDHRVDSSVTGRFPLLVSEGVWRCEAWAEDAGGALSPTNVFTIVAVRLRPRISWIPYGDYHVEDSVPLTANVTDPQNDLAEITVDFDGDGTVDATAPKPESVLPFVFHRTGENMLTIVARDSAGHRDSLSVPIRVVNDNPKIARDSLYLASTREWWHYDREPWKGIIYAKDRENNLIDSVWWDFDGDGEADTVSGLRDTLVRKFDVEGTWNSIVTVKDRAGGWDTAGFDLSVQPYKHMGNAFFGAQYSQTPFAFRNRLWVLGGGYSTYSPPNILSSADGKEWKVEATGFFPGDRDRCTVLEFQGKLWLYGHDGASLVRYRDTYVSTDAITWTTAADAKPWIEAYDQRFIVFQDKIWVFAGLPGENGEYRTVAWNSADGLEWKTFDVGDVKWRFGSPEITVFNGKLWMLMPYFVGATEEILYSSPDGLAWTSAKFTPPWKTRYPSELLPYKGKLWLLGGDGEIWESPDGLAWKRHGTRQTVKSGNRAAVFDGKLFWISDREVYMFEE